VPVALIEVEAVADEELIGHGEAHITHREVVDEPPVWTIEERDGGERGRGAERERPADVIEREPGIDDVLHQEDVSALDRRVEIFEEPDSRASL
jgi:hypothetical protein